MKKIFAILSLAISVSVSAMTFEQAATQYRPYPIATDSVLTLTPTPEGYEPFHLEHYARHGSRWLITNDNYDVPVRELEKAERNRKLTPKGQELLDALRIIRDDSRGRLGELTPLGHQQHRDIARRMGENFPMLFTPGTHLDAKSTIVIRCILSMLNEVQTLNAMFPDLIVTSDASEADMRFMNYHQQRKNDAVDSAKLQWMPALCERLANKGKYLNGLIDDTQFITDSIDQPRLFDELYEVGVNMGSHAGKYHSFLFDVFSPEEIADKWEINNANWYLNAGITPMSSYYGAVGQRELLNNIVASADTAIVSPLKSVNLRFGHDGNLSSLVCMIGVDNWGVVVDNIDDVAAVWQCADLIPMAANIQLVFYRPEGSLSPDDVLVKVLLNEHEGVLPWAEPSIGPYYRWTDIRPHLIR